MLYIIFLCEHEDLITDSCPPHRHVVSVHAAITFQALRLRIFPRCSQSNCSWYVHRLLEMKIPRRIKTSTVFVRTAWVKFINRREWNDGSCSQEVTTVSAGVIWTEHAISKLMGAMPAPVSLAPNTSVTRAQRTRTSFNEARYDSF